MINGENSSSIQPVLIPEDEFRKSVSAAVGAVVGSYLSYEMTQNHIPETQRKEYVGKRIPVYIDGLKRGEEDVLRSISDQDLVIPVLKNGNAQRTYTFNEQGEIVWTVKPISNDMASQLRFLKQAEKDSVKTSGKSNFWTDPFLISQALEQGFKRQQQIYAEFSMLRLLVIDAKKKYKSTIAFLPSAKTELDDFTVEVEALKKSRKNEGRSEQDVFTENYIVKSHPLLSLLPIISQTILDVQNLDNLFPGTSSSLIPKDIFGPREILRPTESEKQKQVRTLAVNLLVDPDNITSINNITAPQANFVDAIRVNEFFRGLKEEYSENNLARMQYLITHQLFSQQEVRLQNLLKQSGFPPDLGIELLQNFILTEIKKMPYPSNLTTTEGESVSNFKVANQHYNLHYEKSMSASVEPIVEKIWNGQIDFNGFTEILYSLSTGSNADKRRFFQTLLAYKPQKNPAVAFDTILSFIANYYRLGYDPKNKIITCIKLDQDEYVPTMRRESKIFLEESLAEVSSSNHRLLRFIQRLMLQSTVPDFLESKGVPESESHISKNLRDSLKSVADRDKLLKFTTAYVLAKITGKDFIKSFPDFNFKDRVKLKRHTDRIVSQIYAPEIAEQNRNTWNQIKTKTAAALFNLFQELDEYSFTDNPEEFIAEMLQRSIDTIPVIPANRYFTRY